MISQQLGTVRTTVALPLKLVERSQQFIGKGAIPSRTALIIAALDHFLDELEREEIDRQFAAMADDPGYRALNEAVAELFAEADWESVQTEERASV